MMNRICNNEGLTWSNMDTLEFESTLPTMDGGLLDIKKLNLIWWRRVNYPQKLPPQVSDSRYIDLINNDCREALFGLLFDKFSGTWINDPSFSRLAENKLIQLSIAKRAGFRTPRTLISQNPKMIRNFCAMLKNNVVMKAVKGTHQHQLFTGMISEDQLLEDGPLLLCPAIYQEYIPGDQHIRAHCFGDDIYTTIIESDELDWRQNLDVPFRVIDLEEDVKASLRNVIKALGLKMGVFDLKVAQGSSPVWLEINPQGQFLFVEGITGLDLTSPFVEFLYQEAKQAKVMG
jgi:glutathione synthase/RimK-type ligase-like ATP-grasp enzyme